MNPNLKGLDVKFVIECLKWNKEGYEERSRKYRYEKSPHGEWYSNNIYKDTMDRMDSQIAILRELSKS